MSTEAPHILIVTSRYYERIAAELEAGVTDVLSGAGASHEMLEVTGAFELPGAIAMAAEAGGYDGFIALGCVIRGETSHYDYVCGEAARGLMDLSLAGVPLGFGVLTCETQDQAWARADRTQKNKGKEVADACLTMVGLSRRFLAVED